MMGKPFYIIVTIGVFCLGSIRPVEASSAIKIVSYNIQGGCTAPMDEGKYDLPGTISALKNTKADVILLQEVGSAGTNKGTCNITDNQSTKIPSLLGMKGYYYNRLLILIKNDFEFIEKTGFSFSSQDSSGASRVYMRAKIRTTDNQTVVVYNTHAERFDKAVRKKQITQLNSAAQKDVLANLPTVVGGDFNECAAYVPELFQNNFKTNVPSKITFTPLAPQSKQTWQELLNSSGCNTITSPVINERIDYLFFDNNNWELQSGDVITGTGTASDHYAIYSSALVKQVKPEVATTDVPVFLTEEKVQELLTSPVVRIKIPGLSFSGVDQVELKKISEDGSTYAEIPFIGEYMSAVYRYLVVIGGIVSVAFIIIAGFEYTIPDPSGESKSAGKKRLVAAVTGLIITVSSYTILYAINPELVQFKNLKIIYIKGEDLPMPAEEAVADATTENDNDSTQSLPANTTIAAKVTDASIVNSDMFMSTQINTKSVDGFSIWQSLTFAQKNEVLPYLYTHVANCPNENSFVAITDIPGWKGKKIHPNAVEPLRRAITLATDLGFKIYPGGTLRTSDSLVKLWNTGVVARYQTKTKGWQSNQGKISSPTCNSPHATGGAVDVNLKQLSTGYNLLAQDSYKITAENYSERFLNDPYKIILEYIFNQSGWVRLCTEHWHFEYGVTERYQKWDKKSRCWAYTGTYDQPISEDMKAKVNTIVGKKIL